MLEQQTNLPDEIELEHIPNEIYMAINEVLADRYGKCADGYCLEIKLSEIDWGYDE